MGAVRIARGLWWDPVVEVVADGPDTEADGFLRLASGTDRLRVGLVLLGGRRVVDLSPQPGAVVHLVRQRAARRGEDANGWSSAIARLVGPDGADTHASSPLVAVLGAACYPMVGQAYAAGAGPVDELPRWATLPLAARVPGEAAQAAFGTSSTRAVARALAASLVPPAAAPEGASLALWPLGLALAASGLVPSDHLVEALSGTDPWRPATVWPSVADIADARVCLAELGPERAASLVCDAARSHRLEPLFPALRRFRTIRHDHPSRLPRRLDDLEQLCTEPTPAAGRPPHRRPDPPVVDDPLPTVGRLAPPTARTRIPERYEHPAPLLAVDGVRVGALRLVLPESPETLRTWGASLRNCLADFVAAVAAGTSWLVGIEDGGRIVGCVEVNPATRVPRQIQASANRPLPDATARAVIEHLEALGVVRPWRPLERRPVADGPRTDALPSARR